MHTLCCGLLYCNYMSSTARLINPSQLFAIFCQVWKSFPWRWSKIKEYKGVMNMYELHWNYLKPLNAIFVRKCNSFWIFHHSSMLKYLSVKNWKTYLQAERTHYFWAFYHFRCLRGEVLYSNQNYIHYALSYSVDFKAPQELWNSLRNAVPGKF